MIVREYWQLNKEFPTPKLREGDRGLVLLTLGVLFCLPPPPRRQLPSRHRLRIVGGQK